MKQDLLKSDLRDRDSAMETSYTNTAFDGNETKMQDLTDERRVKVGSNDFILVEDHTGRQRKVSVKEKVDSFVPWMQTKLKKGCTKKNLYRRLPILQWLPKYSSEDAVGDLVAGVTVGLLVIPQSLAYSNIADLPAQYGLYGSFVGCLMYIFLGSCKDVPMGPTAICSLLTYQTIKGMGPDHAILLCFLSGVIQLIMGLVGLGIMIDFVSGPVSSGFTSAVALLIISSQVKDILGINGGGATFVNMWYNLSQDIQNINYSDLTLGVTCIIILLSMRMLGEIRIGPEEEVLCTPMQKLVNKTIWLIGTSRNSIIVVISGVYAYYVQVQYGEIPFKVIGYIPPGLPDFKLPPFSTVQNNITYNFFDMCNGMGQGIFVLPLIALLENIAICKAFANGKTVDATQELIAIGLCNIGNSMMQSFPGSGSLSRSAVNNSSGVRSPLGGLYTGALVIIALLFFTPCFYYIPKAVLAAVIIAAVVFMVEVRVVKPIWRFDEYVLTLITITSH